MILHSTSAEDLFRRESKPVAIAMYVYSIAISIHLIHDDSAIDIRSISLITVIFAYISSLILGGYFGKLTSEENDEVNCVVRSIGLVATAMKIWIAVGLVGKILLVYRLDFCFDNLVNDIFPAYSTFLSWTIFCFVFSFIVVRIYRYTKSRC